MLSPSKYPKPMLSSGKTSGKGNPRSRPRSEECCRQTIGHGSKEKRSFGPESASRRPIGLFSLGEAGQRESMDALPELPSAKSLRLLPLGNCPSNADSSAASPNAAPAGN